MVEHQLVFLSTWLYDYQLYPKEGCTKGLEPVLQKYVRNTKLAIKNNAYTL